MNGGQREEPAAPAPDQPEDPAAPARRLYREPEEKKLTGLCGGLADYLGADPTVVRLAAVLLVLASRVTIVVYLIAAVVVPERPATVPRQPARGGRTAGTLTPHMIGLLVIALFVGVTDNHWWFEPPLIGLGLLGLGVWLLLGERREAVPAPAPPPPAGPAPLGEEKDIPRENLTTASDESTTLLSEVEPERALVGPPASEATTGTTLDKTEDGTQPVPVPPDPASSVPDDSAHSAGPQGEVPPPVPPWGLGTPPGSGSPPPPAEGSGASPAPADQEPPGAAADRDVLAAVLGVLLVVAGVTALLVVFDVLDLDAGICLAAVLVAVGVGLVVGSWWGRARSLIAVGLPVLGALLFADTADLPVGAGSGDRTVEIDEVGELRDDHELLAGELLLDLRDMPLRSGNGRTVPTVRGEVGIGNLDVVLPEGVTADVNALVGIGEVQGLGVDGGSEGGIHLEQDFVVDGREGGGRIRLDLQVGAGAIEVRRG